MEKVVIKATRRSVLGKQVKALRRAGELPAVMYGHKFEPISITLNAHKSQLILPHLSASTIVTIELDGEKYSALIREKQKDFIKNKLVHVDFLIVSATEKIKASVRIEIHGLSPAVKDFNAVIVTQLADIEVEALPGDMPERIAIDITNLTAIGDSIHVRDLIIPSGVTVLTHEDEMVLLATGVAPEELDETAAVDEPEVIEKGKKESEE